MKKIFLVILLFISSFGIAYCQTTETNKKEIKITIDSKFYTSASNVIIGFFGQAKIYNFMIDEKLDKSSTLNFKITQKTVSETIELLSKIYSIDFQTNEKKDFYFVTIKEKK